MRPDVEATLRRMDAQPPPRTAELVLCTREGSVLGRLPALEVPTPWWQDIEPVV